MNVFTFCAKYAVSIAPILSLYRQTEGKLLEGYFWNALQNDTERLFSLWVYADNRNTIQSPNELVLLHFLCDTLQCRYGVLNFEYSYGPRGGCYLCPDYVSPPLINLFMLLIRFSFKGRVSGGLCSPLICQAPCQENIERLRDMMRHYIELGATCLSTTKIMTYLGIVVQNTEEMPLRLPKNALYAHIWNEASFRGPSVVFPVQLAAIAEFLESATQAIDTQLDIASVYRSNLLVVEPSDIGRAHEVAKLIAAHDLIGQPTDKELTSVALKCAILMTQQEHDTLHAVVHQVAGQLTGVTTVPQRGGSKSLLETAVAMRHLRTLDTPKFSSEYTLEELTSDSAVAQAAWHTLGGCMVVRVTEQGSKTAESLARISKQLQSTGNSWKVIFVTPSYAQTKTLQQHLPELSPVYKM